MFGSNDNLFGDRSNERNATVRTIKESNKKQRTKSNSLYKKSSSTGHKLDSFNDEEIISRKDSQADKF